MPARLGRYAVRRRIGSGGFATVWLAYDEQLDSPVAIKVLAENWTEDSHVRQRFLEEGRKTDPAVLTGPGSGAGRGGSFGRPTDVAFDLQGNIFVADGYTK